MRNWRSTFRARQTGGLLAGTARVVPVAVAACLLALCQTELRLERVGPAPSDAIDQARFLDLDRGWATGAGQAWLTLNGGQHWREVLPPRDRADLGILEVSWPARDALFVMLADGTLLRTPDLGTTWFFLPSPARYPDGQAVTVHFLSPRVGWVGGGRFVPGTLDDPFPNHAHDDYRGHHRVLRAALWKTSDGGQSWTSQTLPDSGAPRIKEIWFWSERAGAVRGEDKILLTRNGGANWSLDSFGPACVRPGLENKERFVGSMQMLNGQVGWLSLGGGPLLRTADGAATWCEVSGAGRTYFEEMAFASESAGVGIGGKSTSLWRTRDGGQMWEPVMGDAIGRAVAALPERALWVFTDEGVYRARL